jgi:hypothetical protein
MYPTTIYTDPCPVMQFRINRHNFSLIKATYPDLNKHASVYSLDILLCNKANLEKLVSVFKAQGWIKIIKTPKPYQLLIKFQTGAEIKRPKYLESNTSTVKCLGGLAVYQNYGGQFRTLSILFPEGITWRSDDIDRLLKGQGCTLRKLEQNLIRATTMLEDYLGGSSEALYLIAKTNNAQEY